MTCDRSNKATINQSINLILFLNMA